MSEVEGHHEAGVVLQRRGCLKEALAELKEAIRLDQKDADAYFSRGNTYGGLGELHSALEDLDEAVSLDLKNEHFYNSRGDVYQALGQYQNALVDYNEVIRLLEYPFFYANRALSYAHLCEPKRVQQDVDRAVELGVDPEPLKSRIEEPGEQC